MGTNVSITGSLDGVVVADFNRVLAGSYATMFLGDLRATAIKVESPSSMLSGLVNFGGAYALPGDIAHRMGIPHPSICPCEQFLPPTGF